MQFRGRTVPNCWNFFTCSVCFLVASYKFHICSWMLLYFSYIMCSYNCPICFLHIPLLFLHLLTRFLYVLKVSYLFSKCSSTVWYFLTCSSMSPKSFLAILICSCICLCALVRRSLRFATVSCNILSCSTMTFCFFLCFAIRPYTFHVLYFPTYFLYVLIISHIFVVFSSTFLFCFLHVHFCLV